jgi:hypothetical protein
MSELTTQELEDKIKMVQKDIDGLMSTGGAGRKLEVLSEYKQYLEDELRMLKLEKRNAGKKA